MKTLLQRIDAKGTELLGEDLWDFLMIIGYYALLPVFCIGFALSCIATILYIPDVTAVALSMFIVWLYFLHVSNRNNK